MTLPLPKRRFYQDNSAYLKRACERVGYFLFLSLGLTRSYRWNGHHDAKKAIEKLVEPEGSKNCRRKTLVLSSMLVIAGIAGADPHDLSVFGIAPSEGWGVIVLGWRR